MVGADGGAVLKVEMLVHLIGDECDGTGEGLSCEPESIVAGVDDVDAADKQTGGEQEQDGRSDDDAARALSDERVGEPGEDPAGDDDHGRGQIEAFRWSVRWGQERARGVVGRAGRRGEVDLEIRRLTPVNVGLVYREGWADDSGAPVENRAGQHPSEGRWDEIETGRRRDITIQRSRDMTNEFNEQIGIEADEAWIERIGIGAASRWPASIEAAGRPGDDSGGDDDDDFFDDDDDDDSGDDDDDDFDDDDEFDDDDFDDEDIDLDADDDDDDLVDDDDE